MNALGLTQQISNYIIRPPRANYTLADLGQTTFEYNKVVYERIDFIVPPQQDNPKLIGSLYVDRAKRSKPRPTVVYLHANSSSRVTVKNYLKNLIQHFDVVAFDFRGCGMSGGNYLTLGYLQKYDVKAVLEYVDQNYGSRRYFLWGRSMGAVTALVYAADFNHNSEKIAGLVLDSPFSDLQKVIYELGDKRLPLLPNFLVGSIIDSLQQHVKQKIMQQYGSLFIIRKHKPINKVPKLKIPVFFIGSKSDQLVDSKNLQQLYRQCVSRKQLEILEGGHNQIRPEHLKLAVVQFLLAALSFKDQTRKRIFDFNKGLSFMEQNSHMLAKSNEKDRQRSKSATNKFRIFRVNSEAPSNPDKEGQKDPKSQQKILQKQEQKRQTGVTHAQILDKVLPKNSTRRKSRIFGLSDPKYQ